MIIQGKEKKENEWHGFLIILVMGFRETEKYGEVRQLGRYKLNRLKHSLEVYCILFKSWFSKD